MTTVDENMPERLTPALRAEKIVREWATGWNSFRPSENSIQCLVSTLAAQIEEHGKQEYERGQRECPKCK